MKSDPNDLESRALKALEEAFGAVPFVRLAGPRAGKAAGKTADTVRETTDRPAGAGVPSGAEAEPDAEVIVENRPVPLLIQVGTSGEPRFARIAALELSRRRDRAGDTYGAVPYPVFVAPYISPRSAAICEQEDIGYVDFAGNCRLAFRGVYIERTGRPNPYAARRPLRSIFSPKAERVLRALLDDPRRRWKDRDLAEAARVSIGHVSNVKKQLAAQEWIQQGRVGWTVTEPEQMLREWQANYRPDRNRRYGFYSLGTPAETERDLSRELDTRQIPYAFTGFSAAARYAPYVRYDRVVLYVATAEGIPFQSVKPVSSGPNVLLIVPGDDGPLLDAREYQDLRIVGPAQTYLDLIGAGVCSEDAAEAMLDYLRKHNWRETNEDT